MKYKQLKVGQAFMFCEYGAVFVRCRGGFRHGQGGPMYVAIGDETVYLYGV